jgi:hypothetical protein
MAVAEVRAGVGAAAGAAVTPAEVVAEDGPAAEVVAAVGPAGAAEEAVAAGGRAVAAVVVIAAAEAGNLRRTRRTS